MHVYTSLNAESVNARFGTYHFPILEPKSLTSADCVIDGEYRHFYLKKVLFRL